MHLHHLVVSLLCHAVWSESRMKNCCMIGEVGHEVMKVVDEAEEQVELVGVRRERKLLDACDLGRVGEDLTGTYYVT